MVEWNEEAPKQLNSKWCCGWHSKHYIYSLYNCLSCDFYLWKSMLSLLTLSWVDVREAMNRQNQPHGFWHCLSLIELLQSKNLRMSVFQCGEIFCKLTCVQQNSMLMNLSLGLLIILYIIWHLESSSSEQFSSLNTRHRFEYHTPNVSLSTIRILCPLYYLFWYNGKEAGISVILMKIRPRTIPGSKSINHIEPQLSFWWNGEIIYIYFKLLLCKSDEIVDVKNSWWIVKLYKCKKWWLMQSQMMSVSLGTWIA